MRRCWWRGSVFKFGRFTASSAGRIQRPQNCRLSWRDSFESARLQRDTQGLRLAGRGGYRRRSVLSDCQRYRFRRFSTSSYVRSHCPPSRSIGNPAASCRAPLRGGRSLHYLVFSCCSRYLIAASNFFCSALSTASGILAGMTDERSSVSLGSSGRSLIPRYQIGSR